MNTTALKVNNHYPEEEFDHEKQMEWAKMIVDQMILYASTAVHTAEDAVRFNENRKRAV